MKSYKKHVLITLMKCLSICFVLFMSFGFLSLIETKEIEPGEVLTDEELELQYKSSFTDFFNNIYQRSFTFHFFVFVLGAFWNVKKILRIGII